MFVSNQNTSNYSYCSLVGYDTLVVWLSDINIRKKHTASTFQVP